MTMPIKKVLIKNFKCFKDTFELPLKPNLNIIVGNNEAGKSTILEAIHLALTGYYEGKLINTVLSQYLFNKEIVDCYLASVRHGAALPAPEIIVEIYFDGSIDPLFKGNGNSNGNTAEGICFSISLQNKYNKEYQQIIAAKNLSSLPIEYYEASWASFGRDNITTRSIPMKSAMIDSSSYRYQNGSDVYISRIVRDLLSDEEITSVAQAHRNMRENFMGDGSIKSINTRIQQNSGIIGGKVALSVDLGTKSAWENSLVTQLNDIPFSFLGKGSQCIVKTELALSHKQAQKAEIVLLEEPECHLSFSKLNQLIKSISEKCPDKQLVLSTHSSYVANKLGLDSLILLDNNRHTEIAELSSADFFKKIAGYDTLRLLLCKRAILVEGDSDELVVQKAYMVNHDGHLPIQDGIDVISVGLTFLRFLEIAEQLHKSVAVVTDNDGKVADLEKKYEQYIGVNKKDYISICYDSVEDTGNFTMNGSPYNYNTLEPKLLKANSLTLFNQIFGTAYKSIDEMHAYMKKNKTECAMKIFDTAEKVTFPDYILKAVQ